MYDNMISWLILFDHVVLRNASTFGLAGRALGIGTLISVSSFGVAMFVISHLLDVRCVCLLKIVQIFIFFNYLIFSGVIWESWQGNQW